MRVFEVALLPGVKILIMCLVFKGKRGQRHYSHSPSWIFKNIHVILLLKKQLAKMFDVKIHLDLYVYTFYVNFIEIKSTN